MAWSGRAVGLEALNSVSTRRAVVVFPCFPLSLARSRAGGSSFHIGHTGTSGLSWRPVSACWEDTGLRVARPRGWTSGAVGDMGRWRHSVPPPSSWHRSTHPSSLVSPPHHTLQQRSCLKPCAVTDPQTPSPVRSWPLAWPTPELALASRSCRFSAKLDMRDAAWRRQATESMRENW